MVSTMFTIRSLEKRFVLFLFVPVILLLVGMGAAGFIYARRTMISQWEEAAVLRLQRAAHFVDMRLSRPKELIGLYLESKGGRMGMPIRMAILNQLRRTPGVVEIHRIADGGKAEFLDTEDGSGRIENWHGMLHRNRAGFRKHAMKNGNVTITPPRYDADVSNETVSLIAQVVGENDRSVETLEVVMDFKFLIEDLPRAGWWETRKSFLVDDNGRILIGGSEVSRSDLGDSGNALELATRKALQTETSGTIRGKGHPPDEISGFHRLMEAPWFIVVFAPGSEILKPIIEFRNYYFLTLGFFMLTILFLIRRAVHRTTDSVKELSEAADQIANGRFKDPLPIDSQDEIGELIRSFNTMSRQLKERMKMKRSLDLAKEVQQNLIPVEDPIVDGLDIAGRSEFCDETGGDYYDYIQDGETPSGRVRIVIGDVAGHGISSALLMSGVRASFRQRHAVAGTIEEVVTDVNRQVSQDVGESGRFMTLFCLEIDGEHSHARWVRAGHEPGLLYRSKENQFLELKGEGIPLGIDRSSRFREMAMEQLEPGDIFMLGTDGLWETINATGEMFGKARLKALVRDYQNESAKTILSTIFSSIQSYRGNEPSNDDMTLIVIKVISTRKHSGPLLAEKNSE